MWKFENKVIKMRPLELNRRILIWMCVYPCDENTTRWKRLAYILFSILIFVLNAIGLIFSTAYFIKYVSIDLEQSLFALLQAVGEANMVYILIITFILRHKITAMLKSLSKIYDMYATVEMSSFLIEVNEYSNWMWLMFLKYVIAYGILTGSIAVVAFQFAEEGDYSKVYRAFKVIFPWNQNTLLGYTAEIIVSVTCAECYMIAGSMIFLFISLCQHHRAFYQMFLLSLRKLDQRDPNRNDKQFLCQLIAFHVSIKQFFQESVDAFSLFILTQLFSAAAMLSMGVFHLDLQLRHINFEVSTIFAVIFTCLFILFLYCYFGKIATESFQSMADAAYEANWQSLTVDLQKHFVLLIQNAQRPVYYHGFGVAILNLETFQRLLKTVMTYYMAFKAFTE